MVEQAQFYGDIAKEFSDDSIRAAATSTAPLTEGVRQGGGAMTYGKAMLLSYPDGARRMRVEKHFQAFVAQKIGTSDINPLLITSLSARQSFIRRKETVLLNLMESAPGQMLVVDDYVYKVIERRQGTIYASRLNPEVTTVGKTELSVLYGQKFNALGFWGDPVGVRFVTGAQAAQQQQIDLLQEQADAEQVRIRLAKNQDYWSGVQQDSFAANAVPQVGGLLNRITVNTLAMGDADLDTTTLEKERRTIATNIGYQPQVMIFAGDKQVDITRKIEIQRYGGANQVAYMRWESEMKARLQKANVPVDRLYEFTQGPPAPVSHDFEIPQDTVVMLTVEDDFIPREARFLIGGQPGPWMWVRQVEDIRDSVFIADGGTMDDPGDETKMKFTGCDTF